MNVETVFKCVGVHCDTVVMVTCTKYCISMYNVLYIHTYLYKACAV